MTSQLLSIMIIILMVWMFIGFVLLPVYLIQQVLGYNQTEYYICGPLDDKICVLGDKW